MFFPTKTYLKQHLKPWQRLSFRRRRQLLAVERLRRQQESWGLGTDRQDLRAREDIHRFQDVFTGMRTIVDFIAWYLYIYIHCIYVHRSLVYEKWFYLFMESFFPRSEIGCFVWRHHFTSGTLNWNLGLNITRHHHEIFAKGNPQKKDHFRVVNVSCQTGFWAPVRHQRLDTHRKSELQPTDSGFFEGRMRSWPRGGVFSQTSEAAMSWQTDAMPEQIWETIDICDRMISHIGWH